VKYNTKRRGADLPEKIFLETATGSTTQLLKMSARERPTAKRRQEKNENCSPHKKDEIKGKRRQRDRKGTESDSKERRSG